MKKIEIETFVKVIMGTCEHNTDEYFISKEAFGYYVELGLVDSLDGNWWFGLNSPPNYDLIWMVQHFLLTNETAQRLFAQYCKEASPVNTSKTK